MRRQYGREEYHRPSRFIRELPMALLNEIRPKARFIVPTTQKNTASQVAHESGFHLGQSVRHDKFGPGVIISIEGQGAHTRVQVKFKESDSKWLVLAYANLSVEFN